jgi:hypothetical protein
VRRVGWGQGSIECNRSRRQAAGGEANGDGGDAFVAGLGHGEFSSVEEANHLTDVLYQDIHDPT